MGATTITTTFEVATRSSLLIAARDRANQKAQAAVAACYEPLIRKWCRRSGLQQADQDDVTQTTLCLLYEKLPRLEYDPSKRFRGLLYTMVYHAIADLHRKWKRQPSVRGSSDTGVLEQLLEAQAPDDPTTEALVQELDGQIERDQRLLVACERVCERVEPHIWQAFWLTTVEGRSAADVAQQLGIKKGNGPVHKYRVIKKIRSQIDGAVG